MSRICLLFAYFIPVIRIFLKPHEDTVMYFVLYLRITTETQYI